MDDDYNNLTAHRRFMDNDEIRYFWNAMECLSSPSYHDMWIHLASVRGGGPHPIPSYKFFRGHWDDELERSKRRYAVIEILAASS